MGVTSASWLGALATLAIPLAIHLWSRRRTKPQAIGSIRFLASVKPVSKRTLRLRNPWRLVMRAALLASLILALAGAFLDGPVAPPAPESWLVIGASVDDSAAAPIIDSLSAEADHVLAAPGDMWSILVSLDDSLPPASSIDVVAPTTAIAGTRPTLAARVNWYEVAESSDPPTPSTKRIDGHREFIVLAGPDRWDDGRYLTAALRTLVAGDTNRRTVRLLSSKATDSLAAAWVAWLSPDAPPAALMEHAARGGVLLTDAEGEQASTATTIALPTPAMLHRRGPIPHGAPIWRDGNGEPLLTLDTLGRGIHYRLATRLHPGWTDLVLRGTFPEAIKPLIGLEHRVPRQRVTPSQAIPRRNTVVDRQARTAGESHSLFEGLWLLALILFGTDVWLLHRGRSRRRE